MNTPISIPVLLLVLQFLPISDRRITASISENLRTHDLQMSDGVKNLDEFATCADWELAGGWTTVDGERVKDDGILEKFDLSLEEAQDMVMTARVMLGWVNPDDLVPSNEDIEE